MAELLIAYGWVSEDSPIAYLRDGLPDTYRIVSQCAIRGTPLYAVVAGPQGLFVLHERDWSGTITASRDGPWTVLTLDGEEIEQSNPKSEMARAEGLLEMFLRDEFPGLRPPIYSILVLTNPDVVLAPEGPAPEMMLSLGEPSGLIEQIPLETGVEPLNRALCQALAMALAERRLTTNQRATQPLLIRGAGAFGRDAEAWTVHEALGLLDRNPATALNQLRSGALADWFGSEGADHLVTLAREAMRMGETEPYVPLERFLIGTGLVARSRPRVSAASVNFGYLLQGQVVQREITVSKPPEASCLAARIHATEPWLQVSPQRLYDTDQVTVTVQVDGTQMRPGNRPYHAHLVIHTDYGEESLVVPVAVRVSHMPSAWLRRVGRPVFGLLVAAILGLLVGSGFGRWAVPVLPGLRSIAMQQDTAALVWSMAVAGVWALLGVWRGYRQPLAWTTSYATTRWLLRLLAWGTGLTLIASLFYWAWSQPDLAPVLTLAQRLRVAVTVLYVGLALAVLPATVGEVRSTLPGRRVQIPPRLGSTALTRRLTGVVGPALVVALLVLVVRVGRPTIESLAHSVATGQAGQWAEVRWSALEERVQDLYHRGYLRLFDPRASAGDGTAP